MISLIAAVGKYDKQLEAYPIGKDGHLPWHHKQDLNWFRYTTMGHPVIMGRHTYESIGKPLNGRRNIVITSKEIKAEGVETFNSLEAAIATIGHDEEAFIIGGEQLYRYAYENELADKLYIDFLDIEVKDANAYLPIPAYFFFSSCCCKLEFTTKIADNARADVYIPHYGYPTNDVDSQYITMLNEIINHGVEKHTRAGDTLSIFGKQLRFNLSKGLPVLTTKKMFMKGCIHELLWFLKGDTNIKYLVENGVHIWDDDALRYARKELASRPGAEKWEGMTKDEFLQHVLNEDTWGAYRFGDLGPVYGYQWTNWNGINQIQQVINTLKTNPDDRRMIISAWNVSEIDEMALPPCHYCCQFYTRELSKRERLRIYKKKYHDNPDLNDEALDQFGIPRRALSCMWNQRSVDTGLGWSFNVMSYAILTHLIAQCVNMVPDELIFSGGDCHIYKNQIEGLKEQVARDPYRYSLPKLVLNAEIKNIEDFTYDDIHVVGYHSYPAIKLPLSVG